jgi:5'-methylthioadenosine phosphorylase
VLAWQDRAGLELVDGGVYWESRGPRLETPAEIRLAAAHASVVGMTIASECVAAADLGLAYAAVCVVENLANGVGEDELTAEELLQGRAANRQALTAALQRLTPSVG